MRVGFCCFPGGRRRCHRNRCLRPRRGGDRGRLRRGGDRGRPRRGGYRSWPRGGGDCSRLCGSRSGSRGWSGRRSGRWSRSRGYRGCGSGRWRCQFAQCRVQGFWSQRGLKELATGHPFGISRGIVNRCENGFHPWQVRLDGFPEREAVCGLKKDLRDENVAASVSVDPFHGLIGVRRSPDFCPAEGLERMG